MHAAARILVTCLLTLPAPAAFAQAADAPLAAPFAELRTYRWEEAFPITPPFTEWIKVGTLDNAVPGSSGVTWLHSSSLHWRADNWLVADMLAYIEQDTKRSAGYVRVKLALSCDAMRVMQYIAMADVTINPQGHIVAISTVNEVPGAYYPAANTIYENLCSDGALRARFMAP